MTQLSLEVSVRDGFHTTQPQMPTSLLHMNIIRVARGCLVISKQVQPYHIPQYQYHVHFLSIRINASQLPEYRIYMLQRLLP